MVSSKDCFPLSKGWCKFLGIAWLLTGIFAPILFSVGLIWAGWIMFGAALVASLACIGLPALKHS